MRAPGWNRTSEERATTRRVAVGEADLGGLDAPLHAVERLARRAGLAGVLALGLSHCWWILPRR